MRCISLILAFAGLLALAAWQQKPIVNQEERWLETSQRQEVIVFNDLLPEKCRG